MFLTSPAIKSQYPKPIRYGEPRLDILYCNLYINISAGKGLNITEQEANQTFEVLTGTVDEVVYKNTENGYIVLTMDVDGAPETVVGTLGDIVEGESLRLHGTYVSNAKYGRQFKAVTCERTLPTTPSEIRKYLGSGIIKGVGPALAKKIVDNLGEQSLQIIESDPMRLSELNGVTPDKALYISSEFRRLCGMKSIVEFLQKYEISPVTASLVWKNYEEDSVSLVRENPYLLCEAGIDVDFGIADKIAADMGLDFWSMNRVKAGTAYVLRQNSYAGHTCLPREMLCERVCTVLGVREDIFDDALCQGLDEGVFTQLETDRRIYIYLTEYYRAENYISEKIAIMLKLSAPLEKDFSEEIAGVEWTEGITYEDLQKAAINAALGNNLFILTGGPGTGKTTTLNAVIRICKSKGKKLCLAAPTGRAAKRMSDLTEQPAKTIHRLLEVDFAKDNTTKFKHNELNPLNADVVIIDEMSMVDTLLFEALLRAVKPESKLIMVGDSNQLPSVGAGNVLRDLIATRLIPTVELKEIFRQAAQSLIVTNAHKIVRGELPELDERKKDFFFMPCATDEETARLVVSLVATRLPKSYGYNPFDDIQILSPTKLGAAGTRELNRALQLALNPPAHNKKEVKFFDTSFRMGDKVMQIKNDYDVSWEKKSGETGLGIYNGDIGIIKDVDTRSGMLTIDFDGRIAKYASEMLNKLEHAYAVTIHKSQGSEYRAVVMPLTAVSDNLLYRNLLYTGITRAKENIILVGTREVVARMVGNDRKTRRYSCMNWLLSEKTR